MYAKFNEKAPVSWGFSVLTMVMMAVTRVMHMAVMPVMVHRLCHGAAESAGRNNDN